MERFNQLYVKILFLLILCLALGFFTLGLGPNAFASGPVGVGVFFVVFLALLLTIINIGYRIITYKVIHETL